MTAPIQDLRDAIALLQQHDNQYLETDHPVDPNAELAGVYRHIGAGGTVKRPTRIGPAMMFNNIKGYPHSRILVGMHASRQRAALLLGCEASQLALEVGKAVKKPPAPRSLSKVSCCLACASERISTPIAATRCRNFLATAAALIRRCR